MNDSPGWATPGSSPSDGERPGTPAEQPPAQPADAPKWSAEQPPPGQWQSPAPGQNPPPQPQQPQPGPGWGAYGGQYGHPGGPGQWGPPPAAKPGVIPLRPLSVGEILDGAVATMRAHWRSVLPITLVVATVVEVVSMLIQKYALEDLMLSMDRGNITPEQLISSLGGTFSVTAAAWFLQFIGTIIVTAMLTMIFSKAVLGQHSSISGAWRDARPQLLRLAGLTLLMAVGAILLFAVLLVPALLARSIGLAALAGFVCIGLFIWLGIKLILASPALMLERGTVFKSFARSSKLVNGSWWRIFGITALTWIIVAIFGAIILFPLQMIGFSVFGGGLGSMQDPAAALAWGPLILTAIGTIIAQAVVMPIQSGVTVLLYVDQRIRREGLDLELARAAGVENYGG
ncbi:glycerophosphoryl diester phosphodiesterase membrane domain-containing protein [Streptomyces sp. NPDC002467]|uniref:glycerophosphoryl diester phosphodiesterase membrane domain-containing protein n=1 Tax=Streptomyces sp. NPDC002467 TaxID=3364647 RepID=UPI0036C64016